MPELPFPSNFLDDIYQPVGIWHHARHDEDDKGDGGGVGGGKEEGRRSGRLIHIPGYLAYQ